MKIIPMKRILYLLLFCSCLLNVKAVVYDDIKTLPNPKTADANAFVSNPDGILNHATVETLNAQLHLLEQETSAEVAIVAVNSIGNQDIADFANRLFNDWGIGKSGKDNGMLILFVLDQREIRFEIGYGLEGVLPDAICKRIQMQVMIPEFKNGNYDAGILEGVKAAESHIRKENYEYFNTEESWFDDVIVIIGIFLFAALMAFFIVQRAVKKTKNNSKLKNNQERYEKFISLSRYNIGMGCLLVFTGIFLAAFGVSLTYSIPLMLSFISFIPAGLYKKQWKKKFRYQPVACPECGKTMELLSEINDNMYLNARESLEDELKSIDADVFRCEDCNENVIFRYNNPLSQYTNCPSCGAKAVFMQSSKVIVPATYSSSGKKKETYLCKFCNQTTTKDITIPRLQQSSSTSNGSGRSSSGGSFGGGRSGGGGATSRW